MRERKGFYQVPCYELARTSRKGGAVYRFCVKTPGDSYFFAETIAGLDDVYLVKNSCPDNWFKMTYYFNGKGTRIIKSIEKATKAEAENFYN